MTDKPVMLYYDNDSHVCYTTAADNGHRCNWGDFHPRANQRMFTNDTETNYRRCCMWW